MAGVIIPSSKSSSLPKSLRPSLEYHARRAGAESPCRRLPSPSPAAVAARHRSLAEWQQGRKSPSPRKREASTERTRRLAKLRASELAAEARAAFDRISEELGEAETTVTAASGSHASDAETKEVKAQVPVEAETAIRRAQEEMRAAEAKTRDRSGGDGALMKFGAARATDCSSSTEDSETDRSAKLREDNRLIGPVLSSNAEGDKHTTHLTRDRLIESKLSQEENQEALDALEEAEGEEEEEAAGYGAASQHRSLSSLFRLSSLSDHSQDPSQVYPAGVPTSPSVASMMQLRVRFSKVVTEYSLPPDRVSQWPEDDCTMEDATPYDLDEDDKDFEEWWAEEERCVSYLDRLGWPCGVNEQAEYKQWLRIEERKRYQEKEQMKQLMITVNKDWKSRYGFHDMDAAIEESSLDQSLLVPPTLRVGEKNKANWFRMYKGDAIGMEENTSSNGSLPLHESDNHSSVDYKGAKENKGSCAWIQRLCAN